MAFDPVLVGMVEKETFEAQAEAVLRLLEAHEKTLSQVDLKHLECAVRNLEQLGAVRRSVMNHILDGDSTDDITEALADHFIRLLHLPSAA
jgi:hypothetical protein